MRFDFSHLSISFLSLGVLLFVRYGGESILNAKLRSMTTRTIKRFSYHDLKLDSFSIGIELMLTVILVVEKLNRKQQTNKTSSY